MTSPRAVAFRATVELGGKTATGIPIPAEIAAALGRSRHPAVRAPVAGYGYRSSVASMPGGFRLRVSAAVGEASGVAAGDEVDADGGRRFAGLSYSKQLRVVLPIGAAKAAEARRRRIDRVLTGLRDGARL